MICKVWKALSKSINTYIHLRSDMAPKVGNEKSQITDIDLEL